MSQFTSKYDNKKCSNDRINRTSIVKYSHLSDECEISQKIKCLELEGIKLRGQVEQILEGTVEILSSNVSDITVDYPSPVNMSNKFWQPKSHCVIDSNYNYNNHQFITPAEEYLQNIDNLQKKQELESSTHKTEKEKLTDTIEQLKNVYFKLKADKDNEVIEVHNREMNQNSVIERLRSNLSELISVNKKQEETLVITGKRLEELNKAEATMRAVEHLRAFLSDVVPLVNDEDVESCAPVTLVDILERCFRDYNADLDNRSRKIKDLEEEATLIKRNLTNEREKSVKELQNRLVYIEVQNCSLQHHIEQTKEKTDHKLEKLREKINSIKNKTEDERRHLTNVIDDLQLNLQDLSHKNSKLNEILASEKKSFEKVLDDYAKKIDVTKAERDQIIHKQSSITAKLDATQSQLMETETNILQLQSEKYQWNNQIESLQKRNKEMEASIASSRKYLNYITESVQINIGDGENTNNNHSAGNVFNVTLDENDEENKIWKPKKYLIEAITLQITNLLSNEREFHCKYNSLIKEYESISSKLEISDNHKRTMEQSLKDRELDIESINNKNEHLNGLLASRNAEIERLKAERDEYFQLFNLKSEELTTIKDENGRLTLMWEDRDRLLAEPAYTQLHNELPGPYLIDTSVGKNTVIRTQLNTVLVELKEMKKTYEDLVSRRDEEERNLQRMCDENAVLERDLKNIRRDYNDLIVENKKLAMKFKDSESEIANLCRDLQANEVNKSRKQTSLEKRFTDLVAEHTSCKTELKIAQDRVKYIEKGGSKSSIKSTTVHILNNLCESSPISDHLKIKNNRLSNLEQQMLFLETNQAQLRDENVKLTDLLGKVTSQNERMSQEVEVYVGENKRLRNQFVLCSTEYSHLQHRRENLPKKVKEGYQQDKFMLPSNYIYDDSNDVSIKQLRDDLQLSIEEAKRILSDNPLNGSNIKLPRSKCES